MLDTVSARVTRALRGCIAAALLIGVSGVALAQATLDELAWAYAISPAFPQVPDDGTLYSLPGSDRSFTLDQIRNRFGPADWFPGDHPAMPPIVAVGRQEAGIWACALCHYPNGQGKPENAGVAGLDPGYFVQQLHDMRNGLRRSANADKANTNLMIAYARSMTDGEIEAAAEYYASMQWRPWIEVVETDTVPKTFLRGGLHLRLEGEEAGIEPIGRRIVESPLDTEGTEMLRNPRAGFIAYVPVGAVAAGEELAATGGGRTIRCAICHGENLEGLGPVPPLRGRSPSYVARQLFDFQAGTRRGAWS
ncbi:MAG: cytochrome C-binding protein, partial [Gammaproteobacteria bacterium]|nr:cytochrome C-binding protein [Gammaproteobacteria bacterium]